MSHKAMHMKVALIFLVTAKKENKAYFGGESKDEVLLQGMNDVQQLLAMF